MGRVLVHLVMNRTLLEQKQVFEQALVTLVESDELTTFFLILLEYRHQLKRIDLVLQPQFELKTEDCIFWDEAIIRLQHHEPIQYIVEEAWFYGRKFKVQPGVLIPRPETEELVSWILEDTQKSQMSNHRLLEIGSGSGCIPITLKTEGYIGKVESWDVSPQAHAIAKENATKLNVLVDFKIQDIYTAPTQSAPYNLLVSNPPYVRISEKSEMKPNVLAYEPELALFVSDQDPLSFYRQIALFGAQSLVSGGMIFFEINQYLSQETVALLQNLGYQNLQVRKDFRGNDRMIRATWITHNATLQ